jgi:class 3 adenylate cyclase
MIRTVLELDLAGYTGIATALEEALDVQAVRSFEDQIQAFVDEGLAAVKLERERVVLGTAGDNAVMVFESAEQMHRFAATLQHATRRYNADKTTPLAKRWFRMGAATGTLEMDRDKRRIIGTTVVRAVRLEAAAHKGAMLIDPATFEALPEHIRAEYGPPRTVKGKRDERYTAYSVQFIEEHLIDRPAFAFLRNRRNMLSALGAVLVIGSLIVWQLGKPGTRPSHVNGNGPTVAEPLRGSADIRVFNRQVAERNDRSISYAGLLPLRHGDQVRLEVSLNQPAFIYLIWIAPSGEIFPVFPWKQGNWTDLEERPLTRIIYPDEDSEAIPMKENVEGREVFLALARSTPWPKDVDLKQLISHCVVNLPVRNFRTLVRFRDRSLQASTGLDRDPDFLVENSTRDPYRIMADRLKKEMSPHFDFVDGAAFASAATSK